MRPCSRQANTSTAPDALRVLFVLRTGLPSERLRANMLGSVMQQRRDALQKRMRRSIEVRFVPAPLSWHRSVGMVRRRVACEGSLNKSTLQRLNQLREWQPNVLVFVKLPPLEPNWQRLFPRALLVVDVVDNLELLHQLAKAGQRQPAGCFFDLALVQSNASRELLLEAARVSLAAPPQVAVVPHQHTNLGGWTRNSAALDEQLRRPRAVGMLVGSRHQLPSNATLVQLAEACCSLHLTLAVYFEHQEEALRSRTAGPLTTVTKYECTRGRFLGSTRSSKLPLQVTGRLTRTIATQSLVDNRWFNFSAQALYNNVGWVEQIDLALLWPANATRPDVLHRPPTRLLFWMCRHHHRGRWSASGPYFARRLRRR